MNKELKILAERICSSSSIVAFTGAGTSTESGISDYRSKGGLWMRHQPVTYQEFLADEQKRIEYWQGKMELYQAFEYVHPNKAHLALAQLGSMGKLHSLITQNIDGLHQMAGNTPEKVIELHGNNRRTICLLCADLTSWEETYKRLKSGEPTLRCRKCQGLLKPDTISFGQRLDQNVLARAIQKVRECDLFMAIGSTLIVEPAASLPRLAKELEIPLAIINLSETPLDDLADIHVVGSAGEVLSEVLQVVKQRNPQSRINVL